MSVCMTPETLRSVPLHLSFHMYYFFYVCFCRYHLRVSRQLHVLLCIVVYILVFPIYFLPVLIFTGHCFSMCICEFNLCISLSTSTACFVVYRCVYTCFTHIFLARSHLHGSLFFNVYMVVQLVLYISLSAPSACFVVYQSLIVYLCRRQSHCTGNHHGTHHQVQATTSLRVSGLEFDGELRPGPMLRPDVPSSASTVATSVHCCTS
jgi:hypothetical protein